LPGTNIIVRRSLSIVIFNKTQRSADYSEIAGYYRPGHADYTFDMKYGFRDYRGGGRSSGRETIGRVAAGAIALKMLSMMGISVHAYAKEIGGIAIEETDLEECFRNPFYMPDQKAAGKVAEYAEKKLSECNSMGGIIECVIKGMPAGAGEPCFEKLDANLGKAILSIGAVKGFELGAGFEAAKATGLTNNDVFRMENGKIVKITNHAGGILGGISDGSDIVFRAAVKPTPSIAALQDTVNKSGENIAVSIKGRHDPMIVPRAVVVVETMAALVLVDALMINMTAKIDKIIENIHENCLKKHWSVRFIESQIQTEGWLKEKFTKLVSDYCKNINYKQESETTCLAIFDKTSYSKSSSELYEGNLG